MKIFKQTIIFLMLIVFLILGVTGLVRVPETQKYFTFIYKHITASHLAFIHDWSGVVLVILIIIHLILKRKWLINMFKNRGPISKKAFWIYYFIISVIIILIVGLYSSLHRKQTINLASQQIKEYQGEKLGSINDFRENSIKGVQYIDRNNYKLQINGLVEKPVEFKYDELLKFQSYQKVVQLDCVEGWSVKALWKGILVRDVFQKVKIKPEAKTIIFYANDGYSTSFPIEYVLKNDIIMAYNLNGIELPPARGFPLQLVAEQKWGYKWIKWITKIELSDNVNYKGFWESRGYNKNGDLNGSKFSD
jgi:hypothetical protein